MLEVKIKKLSKDAVIPKYSHEGDAGMDLTAISKKIVDEGTYGYYEYDTGLAFEIPKGHVGLLFPRSSISKTGAILSNAVGVIDSNYRGNVTFRFKQIQHSVEYNIGDRIGQIVIIPYPEVSFIEVEELSETSRGTGGYGSTGK